MVESLRSVILKSAEYIIQCSMLDVRCSTFIRFFSDQTGCPLAGGRALMKLHFKFMWERFATAIKIDRIPLFDHAKAWFDVH